jgi:helix-turn-helix protein
MDNGRHGRPVNEFPAFSGLNRSTIAKYGQYKVISTGDGLVESIKYVTSRVGSGALPLDAVLAYRVNDAAKAAGLSRSSLYTLMSEGKLRSVLVAGRRLIPADALRELLRGAA